MFFFFVFVVELRKLCRCLWTPGVSSGVSQISASLTLLQVIQPVLTRPWLVSPCLIHSHLKAQFTDGRPFPLTDEAHITEALARDGLQIPSNPLLLGDTWLCTQASGCRSPLMCAGKASFGRFLSSAALTGQSAPVTALNVVPGLMRAAGLWVDVARRRRRPPSTSDTGKSLCDVAAVCSVRFPLVTSAVIQNFLFLFNCFHYELCFLIVPKVSDAAVKKCLSSVSLSLALHINTYIFIHLYISYSMNVYIYIYICAEPIIIPNRCIRIQALSSNEFTAFVV